MKMFNPAQFKKKKKRTVDPNIARPNLFSHEKKLKETTQSMSTMANRILQQELKIAKLEAQVRDLQQSIDMLVNVMRRG